VHCGWCATNAHRLDNGEVSCVCVSCVAGVFLTALAPTWLCVCFQAEPTPEVRVQYVTAVEQYRVTDAPFSVPARLNHKGLSGVISHLLALEDAVPFDYFVDGVLLRTSLRKHMKNQGLSTVRGCTRCLRASCTVGRHFAQIFWNTASTLVLTEELNVTVSQQSRGVTLDLCCPCGLITGYWGIPLTWARMSTGWRPCLPRHAVPRWQY
jgi:hypothetical protein